MFGNNPIRGVLKGKGDILEVQEIFPTVQGEGEFVGVPSIFIRLGGCNLACKFCDTEFENFKPMNIKEIVSELAKINNNKKYKLVTLTGGEPMRQPIEMLCDKLIDLSFIPQIETNGTLFRNINPKCKIVVSPKPTIRGYSVLSDQLLKRANSIKFLISDEYTQYNNVPDIGQYRYNTPVFVQPIDEYDSIKNQKNIDLAIKIASENNFRLSVQMHKLIGIP